MHRSLVALALVVVVLFVPTVNAQVKVGVKTGAQPWMPQPLFQNPTIQTQLKLTPEQTKKMNDAWTKTMSRFERDFSGIADIKDAERDARIRSLRTDFNTQFSTNLGDALNKDQMQRYHQLWLQSQGYEIFLDPKVQAQLRLEDPQLEQIRRANAEFTKQMNEINDLAEKDRAKATARYEVLSRERGERLNTILNERQRGAYRELIGEPFNVPPPFGAEPRRPDAKE